MTTPYNPPSFTPALQRKKKAWPWVLGVLVAFLVVAAFCGVFAARDSRQPVTVTTESPAKASEKPAAPSKQAAPSIGEGEHLVGTDVAAGTYRTPGAADDAYPACVWVVRKDDNQNSPVIDVGGSDKVNAPGRVVLKKGQVFETSGCKAWVKQ